MSQGIQIRKAPDSMRPVAVAIVREAMQRMPSGDSPQVAVAIRRAWTGWDRTDKLRLTTTLAWLCAHLLSMDPDPARREAFLTDLEQL